jgi:hypothetical protein
LRKIEIRHIPKRLLGALDARLRKLSRQLLKLYVPNGGTMSFMALFVFALLPVRVFTKKL